MILLVKILPILIAVLCIAAALLQKHLFRVKLRDPVYTDGVIVRCERQEIYKQRAMVTAMAPVVRYHTPEGERTATSRRFMPEWQYPYRVGETVRICYEKTQPGLFVICGDSSAVLRRDILLTAGIGILLAYTVLWIQYYV